MSGFGPRQQRWLIWGTIKTTSRVIARTLHSLGSRRWPRNVRRSHRIRVGAGDETIFAPRLRSLPFDRYAIYYPIIQRGVEIARVLHSSRDLKQELL